MNRKLIAQGIGNMACGILGGIPITAVVVRGAANADAGARTKMSSFTHGLFLLLSVLLLDRIPEYSILTIDGTECNFIDYDILEIISEYKSEAHDKHIEVHLNNIESVNVRTVH